MRRLRILTWHIHGNYLWYLSQARHDFFLPVDPARGAGYGGRGRTFPFGDNVYDLPADEVRHERFDCILFQHKNNWVKDQFEILSSEQRRLPRVYLEHDPPLENPTDQPHWVDDPGVMLVHVTPFNRLMWDCGRTPTRVIEHGVLAPAGVRYTGEIERGIVVINHLGNRGRRLGPDVFLAAREHVPLDLVGMAAEELGGIGEIQPTELAAFECRYRFFFNPIRYTSLGLAVCEAMTLGMPIVGLATTEMATAIENGVSGFVDTDLEKLLMKMKELLRDPAAARRLGEAARRYALERFDIRRFARDWEETLSEVAGNSTRRASSGRSPCAVS
ncbi:MAG TPA: glycosyltransferase family 4 protein [Pirellulales bacterium]|nr:glycosyltransferase family 4 protein [Pirellulales bacterium]